MSDYGISKDYAERNLMVASDYTQLSVLKTGIIYDQATLSRRQVANTTTVYDIQQRLPYVHLHNVCNAVTIALANETAEGIYILVDEEQPNILQYNFLRGIKSVYTPAWKKFLIPFVRGVRDVVRGRPNVLRRLRHDEDCLRRKISGSVESWSYDKAFLSFYTPLPQNAIGSDWIWWMGKAYGEHGFVE